MLLRAIPVLALALQGCFVCQFPIEPPVDCDLMANASLSVDVVDQELLPVEGALVSFSVDGGPEQPCEGIGDASSFVCGWEQSGAFEVRVEAPGFVSQSFETFVGQGECHVIGEYARVELERDELACDREARPSIVLDVHEAGFPIPGAEAFYASVNDSFEALEEEPCDDLGDGEFICGYEVAGAILVRVEAPGYMSAERLYEVEADECHVETVFDEIELQFECEG